MNKVILIGRLTKDPELTFVPGTGTALTKFTLAVPKYNKKTGKTEADFVPIQIWGKKAESTAKYTHKGSQVSISGRIQTGNYVAKDGSKRYTTDVVADEIVFLGNKKDGESSVAPSSSAGLASGSSSGLYNYDEDITPVDDSDMPF